MLRAVFEANRTSPVTRRIRTRGSSASVVVHFAGACRNTSFSNSGCNPFWTRRLFSRIYCRGTANSIPETSPFRTPCLFSSAAPSSLPLNKASSGIIAYSAASTVAAAPTPSLNTACSGLGP